MTIANSMTMDGSQALAGPLSRRTVAFTAGGLLAISLCLGAVSGLIWGTSVAYPAILVALGVIATTVSIRFILRAQVLTAQRERTIRIERAAATASKALLKREFTGPPVSALAALINGVDVATVFLETNTDQDLDENDNLLTVRDVLFAERSDGTPRHWDLTGWRLSAAARLALGSGGAFVPRISALDSRTVALYRASRIGTEVLVPITAEGKWVGSLGFTSKDATRTWCEQ